MQIVYGLLVLFVLFIIISKLDDGEHFTSYFRPIHNIPYNKKYYRQYYVPAIVLPPGYTDINYLYKNKKGIPIISSLKYCRDKPQCYPCPNWRYMGTPMCNSSRMK